MPLRPIPRPVMPKNRRASALAIRRFRSIFRSISEYYQNGWFWSRSGLVILLPNATPIGSDLRTVTVMPLRGYGSQRTWIDSDEVLPVTSGRSSDMRQAATPTHTVSIRDVTSRSMKENWLNSFAPQITLEFRGSEHGLPSRKIQLG
jgi:hypothetical protein